MNVEFSMEKFLNKLKTDKFITALGMPIGYIPGLPIIKAIKGETCLVVPFYKRKTAKKKVVSENGELKKSFSVVETYPVRYTVTYALKAVVLPEIKDAKQAIVLEGSQEFLDKTIYEGKPIAFEDLSYRADYTIKFENKDVAINPNMPIGPVLNKKISDAEYREILTEAYALYDKVINTLIYDNKASSDMLKLINKLHTIVSADPALKPFYIMIDSGPFGKGIVGME